VEVELMVVGYRSPGSGGDLGHFHLAVAAGDFIGYNELLFAIDIDREGGTHAGLESFVAVFNRHLNILRIMVAAPDND
jgi:hypothetical protein